jgi:hypothetical protein
MKMQNVTLKLPLDTLQRAKVLAAERRVSLRALLTRKLEDAIGEDASYQAAQRSALKWLEAGWHLGGRPSPRERAHD